jgi:hypothetical protein
MSRILLTVFTLLCFTGCASMQPLQQTPPATTQEAPATEDTKAGSSNVWIVLGVLAALVAVVVLTNDDGGGGGGGGGY